MIITWLSKRKTKMGGLRVVFMSMVLYLMICCNFESSEAAISKSIFKQIKRVNKGGPYTGVLVSRSSELQPLFDSPVFRRTAKVGHLDFAGRRFHIGHIGDRKMILARTGKGMRYGDGPDDELPFEEKGYFTRDYGYLNFADYTNKTDDDEDSPDNFLNNIWYQPEEIFPADGSPDESKDTIFWVPTDSFSFRLAKKLEGMRLEECINITTCLPKTPKVVTVKRGSSASIYLDNVAYKSFLNSKFQVSPVDMEGAAIALISHQHNIPFIAFKALHDLAAGDESSSSSSSSSSTTNFKLYININEAAAAAKNSDIFLLLIENCIKVIIQFIINMGINDMPADHDDIIISST